MLLDNKVRVTKNHGKKFSSELAPLLAESSILFVITTTASTCRSGYSYLNQSKDDSFVERVAKNNS